MRCVIVKRSIFLYDRLSTEKKKIGFYNLVWQIVLLLMHIAGQVSLRNVRVTWVNFCSFILILHIFNPSSNSDIRSCENCDAICGFICKLKNAKPSANVEGSKHVFTYWHVSFKYVRYKAGPSKYTTMRYTGVSFLRGT